MQGVGGPGSQLAQQAAPQAPPAETITCVNSAASRALTLCGPLKTPRLSVQYTHWQRRTPRTPSLISPCIIMDLPAQLNFSAPTSRGFLQKLLTADGGAWRGQEARPGSSPPSEQKRSIALSAILGTVGRGGTATTTPLPPVPASPPAPASPPPRRPPELHIAARSSHNSDKHTYISKVTKIYIILASGISIATGLGPAAQQPNQALAECKLKCHGGKCKGEHRLPGCQCCLRQRVQRKGQAAVTAAG